MGRSRYKVYESTHPHFLTLTVLHWILLFINKNNITTILEQLAFYKKAHKKTSKYQVWQEGIQPKLIQDENKNKGLSELSLYFLELVKQMIAYEVHKSMLSGSLTTELLVELFAREKGVYVVLNSAFILIQGKELKNDR